MGAATGLPAASPPPDDSGGGFRSVPPGTVDDVRLVPPGGVPPPPADPEDWSDDQWIAWLDATDPEESSETGPRLAAWRSHPVGSVLGAAMLGLRDAIYGRPDDEVAIVKDAPSGPPGGDQPDVRLDPDHPERSQVVARRRPDEA
jgi:hypothetical protein